MVALAGKLGRRNDICYTENGILLAHHQVVAVGLATVAYWQQACCGSVATYSIASYCWPSSK